MRWEDAVRSYTELIERCAPGDKMYVGSAAEMHLQRGMAFLRLKEFPAAERDFAVAANQWREGLMPVLLLAEAYYYDGAPAEAEKVLRRFYDKTQLKAEAAQAFAIRYYHFGDTKQGLKWAERIGDEILRKRTKGPLLMVSGQSTRAILAAKAVLRSEPQDPVACAVLCWAYTLRGYTEEALELARRTIRLNPRGTRGFLLLAGVQAHKGKFDCAIESLKKSFALRDTIPARMALAVTYYAKGDAANTYDQYRKTLRVFSKWCLRGHPLDLMGLSDFGPFLERLRKHKEALDLYRWVLRRVPDHDETHDLVTQLLTQSHSPKLQKTLSEFTASIKADFEKGGLQDAPPRMLSTLGLALAICGKSDDMPTALHYARLAASRSKGKNPAVLLALSRVLEESGQTAAAISAMEKALRLEDVDPSLQVLLSEKRRLFLPRIASYESARLLLEQGRSEFLLKGDSPWRFFKGTCEPSSGLEWTAVEFADRHWEKANGPFGNALGFRYRTWLPGILDSYTTLYLRRSFSVQAPLNYRRLYLAVKAPGFVAYLNGKEIGRFCAGDPGVRIPFNATSTGNKLRLYRIEIPAQRLRPGENCLAIQALNRARRPWAFYFNAVLVGELRPEPASGRKLLEAFSQLAEAPSERNILLYLKALLLAEQGRPSEAAEKLSQLIAKDPASALPHLSLAQILRQSGKTLEAEKLLRSALPLFTDRHELWDLWHKIAFLDLGLSPAQALRRLDSVKPEAGEYGAAVLSLYRGLSAEHTWRVNCGGPKFANESGKVWVQDAFFAGGLHRKSQIELEASSLPHVYKTYRMFANRGALRPGYRIPLPRGTYRVKLFFSEPYFLRPGKRLFEVELQGKRVLGPFDPLSAQSPLPTVKTFQVAVTDGFLNIRFLPKKATPSYAALKLKLRYKRRVLLKRTSLPKNHLTLPPSCRPECQVNLSHGLYNVLNVFLPEARIQSHTRIASQDIDRTRAAFPTVPNRLSPLVPKRRPHWVHSCFFPYPPIQREDNRS